MTCKIQCCICKKFLKQKEPYVFTNVKTGTVGNEIYATAFMSATICYDCLSEGLEIYNSKEGNLQIKINKNT